MFLVVYFSNLHLKLSQYSVKLCSASGQTFYLLRSSSQEVRGTRFLLRGGRDPALCSQRERTSNHTGLLCC